MGDLRGVPVRIRLASITAEGGEFTPAIMTMPAPLNWFPAKIVRVPLAGNGIQLIDKSSGRRVYVLFRNLDAANVLQVQPGGDRLAQGKTIDPRDHFIISSINEWYGYCATAAMNAEVMTADLMLEGTG